MTLSKRIPCLELAILSTVVCLAIDVAASQSALSLKDADSLLRLRKYPEAEAAYRKLAETSASDKSVAARCWFAVAKCQLAAKRAEDAVQTYTRIGKEFPEQDYYAAASLLFVASNLASTRAKKYEEAIAPLKKLIESYADQEPQATDALGLLATCYKYLKRPKDALPVYRGLIERFPSWRGKVADAWYQTGVLCQAVDDPSQAIAAYETVASKYPEEAALVQNSLKNLAAIHSQQGKHGLARQAHSLLLEKFPDDAKICALARLEIARTYRSEGQLEEAIRLYRIFLRLYPGDLLLCRAALSELAEAYFSTERFAEALATAKVNYGIAGNDERSLTAAVNLVTRALKAKQRSLAAVNDYLDFQEFGPLGRDGKAGTEDDLTNPLADVRFAWDAREKEAMGKVLQEQPPGLKGERVKGYLCLLHDMPDQAIQHFRRVYALSEPYDAALNSAVDELVRATRALHGHAHLSQVVVDFLSFGPSGKDDNKGTPDDVVDPFSRTAVPPERKAGE